MTDSSNTRTKVAQFKELYKTALPQLPTIIRQGTTGTHPCTLPAMPELEIWGSIQLVHEPSIPVFLIDGLDRYADILQESQLDQARLEWAKRDVEYAINRVSIDKIRAEDSVLPFFKSVVANPVQSLCRALGLEVEYAGGPRIANLNPDYAWLVADQTIAIFEHKTPRVAGRHFPKIVTASKERVILNLQTPSNNAASILSKLIVTSLSERLSFCAVHSGVEFIFIHIVWDNERQRCQAKISDIIPLTSSTTPIISVILALILRSRKDNRALKDRSLGVQAATTGNISSQQDAAGSHTTASAPEPDMSLDQQGGDYPSNPPTNTQVPTLNSLTVSDYWEPRELSEGELAALLNTMNGISLYWDMERFSKSVFRPLRRKDSSLWNKPLPVEAPPRLLARSPRDRHIPPPPSPPMVPFVLCLKSAVDQGAVGSVYGGGFHDLSIPIIVKILPTDRMDHELEIWRRLRGLAGMGVPGLFGAYSLEGKEGRRDTGALVQQHAGKSLSSFDELNLEQRRVVENRILPLYKLIQSSPHLRRELYHIVAKIHEANVEHGDLEPRNVTLDSHGRVMVIDFSHSWFHQCERENCDELKDLRQELELPE